jgi:hypothetical protein
MAFIGMELDSVLMRARLPTRGVQAILTCLDYFRQGRVVSALTCQRLLGLLTAVLLLIPLGLLHLRPLQRWFNSHRLRPKCHHHRQLRVTAQCLRVLLRWRSHSFLSDGVEMLRMCRRELVSTDASQIGWGCVTKGRSASGCWLPLGAAGTSIHYSSELYCWTSSLSFHI